MNLHKISIWLAKGVTLALMILAAITANASAYVGINKMAQQDGLSTALLTAAVVIAINAMVMWIVVLDMEERLWEE